MKTQLLLLSAAFLFSGIAATGQTGLAPNQNPDYAISRAKYMQSADSLTSWQGITIQETYKAIDWLADRQQARTERREFRRQLRLQNARWGNSYYDNDYYYYPSYRNRWGNYRNYYNNGFYRRNSFYINPWGTGYWWR